MPEIKFDPFRALAVGIQLGKCDPRALLLSAVFLLGSAVGMWRGTARQG